MILMNAISIIFLAPLVKKIKQKTLHQMFRHSKLFKSTNTQTKSTPAIISLKITHTLKSKF